MVAGPALSYAPGILGGPVAQLSEPRRFKPCIWCTQPVEIGTDVCGFCKRSQARTRVGLLALLALILVAAAVLVWWLRAHT